MNEQNLKPWKPGQSGNPAGRAKGSRNKLGEKFIAALCDDFEQHGTAVITKVRTEQPAQYLRVIAMILPKELNMPTATLADMSDDELMEIVALFRSYVGAELALERGEAELERRRESRARKQASLNSYRPGRDSGLRHDVKMKERHIVVTFYCLCS
jgi:hypothetical protein